MANRRKRNRGRVGDALLRLDKEPVLKQSVEDHADVLDVLLLCSGENQDTIQVNNNHDVQHISEYVVYQDLEDNWGIG